MYTDGKLYIIDLYFHFHSYIFLQMVVSWSCFFYYSSHHCDRCDSIIITIDIDSFVWFVGDCLRSFLKTSKISEAILLGVCIQHFGVTLASSNSSRELKSSTTFWDDVPGHNPPLSQSAHEIQAVMCQRWCGLFHCDSWRYVTRSMTRWVRKAWIQFWKRCSAAVTKSESMFKS